MSDFDFDVANDRFGPGGPTGYFDISQLLPAQIIHDLSITESSGATKPPPAPAPYRVEYTRDVRPAFAARQKEVARPKGGRPAIYEWDQATRELLRQIGQGIFRPTTQEQIATWFADHFSERQGEEPAPSDRRQRAGEVLRALAAYAKCNGKSTS